MAGNGSTKRWSGQCCAAKNCSNKRGNKPGLSFFRFPKNPARCREWVINSDRTDLMSKTPKELYTNYVICQEHFKDHQFWHATSRRRLLDQAVPTVFHDKKAKEELEVVPVTTSSTNQSSVKERENKLLPRENQVVKHYNSLDVIKLTVDKSKRCGTRSRYRVGYNKEDLKNAIESVLVNAMTIKEACTAYDIPHGTLMYNLRKATADDKIIYDKCNVGNLTDGNGMLIVHVGNLVSDVNSRFPDLTVNEEAAIVGWMTNESNVQKDIRLFIKNMLDSTNRLTRFSNNLPPQKWIDDFITRKMEEDENVRRFMTSQNEMKAWHAKLSTHLASVHNINAEPFFNKQSNADRIWCCDTLRFHTSGDCDRVDRDEHVKQIGANKDAARVFYCASASGIFCKPVTVCSTFNFDSGLEVKNPDEHIIQVSKSGLMCSEIFHVWLSTHFYPLLVIQGIKFPVVLFFDENISSLSVDVFDFCKKSRIVIYPFVNNLNFPFHPLDFVFSKNFKDNWNANLEMWKNENPETIYSCFNFFSVFDPVWKNSLQNRALVKEGFARCGIVPFNCFGGGGVTLVADRRSDEENFSQIDDGCVTYPTDCLVDDDAIEMSEMLQLDVVSEETQELDLYEKTLPKSCVERFEKHFEKVLSFGDCRSENDRWKRWLALKVLADNSPEFENSESDRDQVISLKHFIDGT